VSRPFTRRILSFCTPQRNDKSNLGDQTHRELVYRPFQLHKRRPLFIGTHNEPFSVIAMRQQSTETS